MVRCITNVFNGFLLLLLAASIFTLQSCTHPKKVFKSDCDLSASFRKVSFKQLIDSIDYYDQQYVEVYGKYEEGKEQSALVADRFFVDHSDSNALWVNFSQDCPLYLSGTRTGLFEYNDGQFTPINNKKVVIRGRIDLHNKGHLQHYKGTIDHVSLVKL